MSAVEEYAYSFRIIVLDKTPDELVGIGNKIAIESADSSIPLFATSVDNYMTISFNEDTEFPDMRLPFAVMIAKTALREHGVKEPVFIKAFATPMNGEELADIHKQIIIETERDYIINLTDELIRNELSA